MVVVQHFFDARPRRGRRRRRRRSGFRLERRKRIRIRRMRPKNLARPGRLDAQHDFGRRRRRDFGRAQRPGADAANYRRQRRDHDRRRPPAPNARARRARLPGDGCQQFGDQIEIRQSLRLPRIADGRHQARDRRDDRRQNGDGLRLRRCRQGLRAGLSRLGRGRVGGQKSIRFAPCKRRWRATAC